MWVQKVPGGGVTSLAYAPDGRTLYVLDGRTVTAWDTTARTGTPVFQVPSTEQFPTNCLFVGADSRFLGLLRLAGGIVWNLETGDPIQPLTPELSGYGCCVVDRVAPRVWYVADGGRAIDCWDLDTGTPGPSLSGWPTSRFPDGFAFPPTGRTVILSTADHSMVVFDPAAGSYSGYYSGLVGGIPRFSPDGHTLALTDRGRVELRDSDTWAERVPSFPCHKPNQVFDFHPHAPVFVALNPDRALTLFSLETGRPIRTYDFALGRQVNCVAFAPDGLTCAAGGSNKRFVVFDVDL